jgi:hypothetical protein
MSEKKRETYEEYVPRLKRQEQELQAKAIPEYLKHVGKPIG